MKVDIDDKVYEDIVLWCDLNGVSDFGKYINECIKKQHYIDKYGDLNRFFQKKEELVEIKKPDKTNELTVIEKTENIKENDNIEKKNAGKKRKIVVK